ncbi:hypothetical protein ACHAXA_002590 [Cyclostephanos tholiformis]|jgi:hypothetical protein|uniref:DUF4378 domain-containing protein n=1 Tax=Cyclostephanos tholiformis TaxID=382380 RepID=A0ABD3RJE4_9STRA
MSSAKYLTLEEFTSSTSPLPSILLPRPRALQLLELCELAEMTPPVNVLDFGNYDDNNDGGIEGSRNPPVLVTQMALLLYLEEYTHVHHLWRRHSDSRVMEEIRNKGTYASSNDHAQLELLWKAAKYCCLWSTGGIYSLTSSSSSDSVVDLVSFPSSVDDGAVMQVESSNAESAIGSGDEDNVDGSSAPALPYSTIALRAFQSCASQNIEPLSTFSAELLVVFRSRVNRELRRFFHKLDCGEFCLRMNLENPCAGEGVRDEVWNAYGWKDEGGYLVSDVDDAVMDYDDSDEEEHEAGTLGEKWGRIERLTDIIMFLEGKMNA